MMRKFIRSWQPPAMRRWLILCGVAGGALLCCQMAAADPNIRFQRLSVRQGLPQAQVTCTLQDQQGFMWFGTEEGLSRYDGHHFVNFSHDPNDPSSLSHNTVKALLEDRAGNL